MRPCFVLLLLAAPLGAAPLPDAYLAPLKARHIGPANMSGRITSIAVYEAKSDIQYVGTASGGVWKSTDGGKGWVPLFDDQPTLNIGAVAVSPTNPDIVWVGTGESNARNSVSWGDGVYRSTDGGKTWQHKGLRETQHIGKVIVHSKDPNIVFVAALGRVWGPNRERGIFRTDDGGKTWQHVLALDADTGCIDLASDPSTPDVLFAAAYQVRRGPYSGGNPRTQFGPKAGLYRSTDGGKTWMRLSRGLPLADFGRAGVAVFRANPKVVFAVIQTTRTNAQALAGQPPRPNNNPETGGIFRSDDGGDTWIKINDLVPRPFYFGQIRIDPQDANRFFVLGIPLYSTADGGKSFREDRRIHVDHHDLWIDPTDPRKLMLGNDGGVYYSTDRAGSWSRVLNLPVAQFYAVAADERKPYRVYGGLQDNGTWTGPSRTSNPAGILLSDWRSILGGDGFQCLPDPTDPNFVYVEAQYGRVARINLLAAKGMGKGKGKKGASIQPKAPKGQPGYRFNWNTPLVGSPHDKSVVYVGGNHVFRSTNKGASWEVLSPDLTRGEPGPSKVSGHTLTTIAESPVQAGLLYAGSDDGRVHVRRNGKDWIDLSDKLPGVPANRWITRIEPSPHVAGVAWLALSRHRNDDQKTYLFRTDDFGATWKSMSKGLPPASPVNTVKLDARNPDLVYVGLEHGLWFSVDGGASWQPFRRGLPQVPVHDVFVHPRDRELVLATHGRGIYVVDALPLQELTAKVRNAPAHLFPVLPVGKLPEPVLPPIAKSAFAAPNPPPGAAIYYAWKEKPAGAAKLEVSDDKGRVVARLPVNEAPGLHLARWGQRLPGPDGAPAAPAPPGAYTVRLTAGDVERTQPFRIEAE